MKNITLQHGSWLTVDDINNPTQELINLITNSGLTPDANSSTQVLTAITNLIEKLSDQTPIGTIIYYYGTADTIPNKYLLCDGSEYDNTVYDKLYSLLSKITEHSDAKKLPNLLNKYLKSATNANGKDVASFVSSQTMLPDDFVITGVVSKAGKHTPTATVTPSGEHTHTITINENGEYTPVGNIKMDGQHTHSVVLEEVGEVLINGIIETAGSHVHDINITQTQGITVNSTTETAGEHKHMIIKNDVYSDWYPEAITNKDCLVSTMHYNPSSMGNAYLAGKDMEPDVGKTSQNGQHTHDIAININGIPIKGATATSGEHAHKVTISTVPKHTHKVTVDEQGAHTHSISFEKIPPHAHTGVVSKVKAHNHLIQFDTVTEHTHNININYKGGGAVNDVEAIRVLPLIKAK